MQTITTTELRTKTSKLVAALKAGKRVTLIHRSKIIGVFRPVVKDEEKIAIQK